MKKYMLAKQNWTQKQDEAKESEVEEIRIIITIAV